MTPAIALVTLVFHFTLPAFNAATDDSGNAYCEVGATPLTDLNEVQLWEWPQYTGQAPRIVDSHSAWGQEAQPDSFVIQRESWWGAHYWVTTKDHGGNLSCPSNRVHVGTVTSVETPTDSELLEGKEGRWFNLQGRKLNGQPTSSGVYFYVPRPGARGVKYVYIKGQGFIPRKRVELRSRPGLPY